jgi:hypothetical protein
MLRAGFGEKCIIMQFLGMEKNRKDEMSERSPEVSGAEFAEKD